jgi:ArsR family transcriptional regulator, arsenate/arsenite/antimonite-responsive transcriptional repressor
MKHLIKSCKALADETRLRILNLLLKRECCVCEVMQVLDISQTRASRNLSILHNAGFLRYRKEGLWALYSVDREAIAPYQGLLAEAVRHALAKDDTATGDRQRLQTTRRICPK